MSKELEDKYKLFNDTVLERESDTTKFVILGPIDISNKEAMMNMGISIPYK